MSAVLFISSVCLLFLFAIYSDYFWISQSLEDVTGGEFKMFMDFLTSLSIFGWKAPQERMQELVEIIEGQADLNAQFDVSFIVLHHLEDEVKFIVA